MTSGLRRPDHLALASDEKGRNIDADIELIYKMIESFSFFFGCDLNRESITKRWFFAFEARCHKKVLDQ